MSIKSNFSNNGKANVCMVTILLKNVMYLKNEFFKQCNICMYNTNISNIFMGDIGINIFQHLNTFNVQVINQKYYWGI